MKIWTTKWWRSINAVSEDMDCDTDAINGEDEDMDHEQWRSSNAEDENKNCDTVTLC